MFADQLTLNVRSSWIASCLEQLGRTAEAKVAWQEAVEFLEAEMQKRPDDFRVHLDLAVPLAMVGRGAEALESARRAVQLMPMSKDVEAGPAPLENLVRTHLRLGQVDEAFDALEELPRESTMSAPLVRLDPRLAALVQHPRFPEFERRSK
jgi:tetratricopeptide (TPR) repeat protein